MRFRLSVPVWAMITCALFALMTMIMLTFLAVGIDTPGTEYSILEIPMDVFRMSPFFLPQVLGVMMLYIYLNTSELSLPRIILSLITLSPYIHVVFLIYCVVMYDRVLVGPVVARYLICFIIAEGFQTYYVVRYLSNVLKTKREMATKNR